MPDILAKYPAFVNWKFFLKLVQEKFPVVVDEFSAFDLD